MSCPNPYELQKSWECTFLKVYTHTKTKRKSKTFFTQWIKNYHLSSTAISALMDRIGHVALLMILKAASEKVFCAHFEFLWVETFKKLHSQLSCNLQGLGQPFCFKGSPSATCEVGGQKR